MKEKPPVKPVKLQIVDINKKKDYQVLQDLRFSSSQRFVRMFDLIEFCIAFSGQAQLPIDDRGRNIITLKKKST
jgi:hypothetical protein